jgi:2-dehydro-3-deoxyphosphogluconate aldolase/(4S)-4-hydroxy-2-oxoglutarate aldolase
VIDLEGALHVAGVVPVVEIADAETAAPLAEALLAGGIACVEITFRTDAAAAAIAAIRSAVPEMLVGAGTVLTPEQADVALAAGAHFLVAPGFGPSVVRHAAEIGLPIVPGACTPTEIQMALAAGIALVKFFPAEAAGGIPYLRALTGPFGSVRFVPTGGVDAGNLAAYLAVPGVVACGGSWLVRRAWLARGDFGSVRAAAEEAATIVAEVRRDGAIVGADGPADRQGAG